MNYEEIVFNLFKAKRSPSTEDTPLLIAQRLNHELCFPTAFYPTIHVAGSNGKGSVSTKIAKVLELSGYNVGLYTSPHIFSLRERVMINGLPIAKEDVVQGMLPLFSLNERLSLNANFFELMTFLAFDYFRKKKVDVAVIETGLGGRLDATNVIEPLLSVITSISCEHTQLLGKEIDSIAAEKAGIIKKNTPVILGPKARLQAIYTKAEQMQSPVFPSKKTSCFFDEENSAVASLALDHLAPHLRVDPEVLFEGLAVRPPCRLEKMGEVIFDVAHNPEAIFSLLQALHSLFPGRKFRFVVGFSQDKEYDRCLDLIADVATHIHLVKADSKRSTAVEVLQAALSRQDPKLFTGHPCLEEGVHRAYEQALACEELLVITGSFYLMPSAKEALGLSSSSLIKPLS